MLNFRNRMRHTAIVFVLCLAGCSVTEPPPTKVEGFSVFGAPSAQSYILFRLKSEVSNQLVENETGVVTQTRVNAVGALVYSLRAPGIHIDTRDSRPSLSIGLYEVTHVFPSFCEKFGELSAMRNAELFAQIAPQFTLSRVKGVQLQAGPGEASFTIGLREQARLISLDRTQSFRREFKFNIDRPFETSLKISSKDACIKR